MKQRLHHDIGSSLLELALVLPMLLLTMIGAAELGRIAYAAMEVSNAARAAVDYGAQSLTTAQDTTGMKNAATYEASGLSKGILTFPTSPTMACVCETVVLSSGKVTDKAITGSCVGAGSTALTTQCTANTNSGQVNNLVQYVQVSTQATVKTMFRYNWNGLGLPSSFTLNGYAQMRVRQD